MKSHDVVKWGECHLTFRRWRCRVRIASRMVRSSVRSTDSARRSKAKIAATPHISRAPVPARQSGDSIMMRASVHQPAPREKVASAARSAKVRPRAGALSWRRHWQGRLWKMTLLRLSAWTRFRGSGHSRSPVARSLRQAHLPSTTRPYLSITSVSSSPGLPSRSPIANALIDASPVSSARISAPSGL